MTKKIKINTEAVRQKGKRLLKRKHFLAILVPYKVTNPPHNIARTTLIPNCTVHWHILQGTGKLYSRIRGTAQVTQELKLQEMSHVLLRRRQP